MTMRTRVTASSLLTAALMARPAAAQERTWSQLDLAPRVRIYPPTMDGYLIGELAQRSGMRRRALRRYEARGILPTPRRTASGYRVYPRESLELLSFIAGDRRLGLTLAEIRHIATGAKSPESTRGDNLG